MKFFILAVILSLFAWTASCVPIDPKRILVNRPKIHGVLKRSPQYRDMYVKGQSTGVKGYNPTPPPQLRKGQYMCGSKVCRLRPGEVPRGCDGVCQYAV